MNIYDNIRDLIRQGKTNKEIQYKLFVTNSQINRQRRKLIKENMRCDINE
jgi:hypothetical protein